MPNPTTGQLLQQGLIVTVLGMGLVFAALALLWGLMELLMRLFPAEQEVAKEPEAEAVAAAEEIVAAADLAAELTAERARVAAVVASIALAHALPGQMGTLQEPVSGDGKTAQAWVVINRSRFLQNSQPRHETLRQSSNGG